VGKKFVGKIDLKGAFSFFEIEKDKADDILKGFSGVEFEGRQVRVEITSKDAGAEEKEGKKKYKKSFSKGKRNFKDFKKPGSAGGFPKRNRY
jgi:ATP-dependent RNA helicase DeaD